jgi:hypothetical protein
MAYKKVGHLGSKTALLQHGLLRGVINDLNRGVASRLFRPGIHTAAGFARRDLTQVNISIEERVALVAVGVLQVHQSRPDKHAEPEITGVGVFVFDGSFTAAGKLHSSRRKRQILRHELDDASLRCCRKLD